jgi:hypothetical protein
MELGVIDDHRKVIPDKAVVQGPGVGQEGEEDDDHDRPEALQIHKAIIP